MESMAWDMERNFSHDNMKLKVEAFPCHGEAKYHVRLRISWLSKGGSWEAVKEVGTTFIERTYDGGLDVLNTDIELQRCRLCCDIFNVFSHVRALGIFGRWGDQIVRFSNDAIMAARESCSLGVELHFEMQVLQLPWDVAAAQATFFVPVRRKLKMKVDQCAGKGDYKNEDCPICLDSLGEKATVIWTPCAHVFHDPCLKQWLKKKKICPICRMKF